MEVWCFSLAVSNGNGLFLLSLPPCMSTYHAGLKWLEQLCEKVFRHNGENQGPSQITTLLSQDPKLELCCTKTSINCRLKSVKGQHSDNRNRSFNLIFCSFYKKTMPPKKPKQPNKQNNLQANSQQQKPICRSWVKWEMPQEMLWKIKTFYIYSQLKAS